jgi:hypothetical protein
MRIIDKAEGEMGLSTKQRQNPLIIYIYILNAHYHLLPVKLIESRRFRRGRSSLLKFKAPYQSTGVPHLQLIPSDCADETLINFLCVSLFRPSDPWIRQKPEAARVEPESEAMNENLGLYC